jgi:hypothetical protein
LWVKGTNAMKPYLVFFHTYLTFIADRIPLPDIKPYVPEFDAREVYKKGWLEKNISKFSTSEDDGRFLK